MSESVLLFMLHLHKCLNLCCSWCCTCTNVWICIALDAALAQMSESVLLLMLHLHKCLNLCCSWCCTCINVWICIAVDVAFSQSLNLYCSWCCTWRKCLNVYRCLMLHLHWRPHFCTFAIFDLEFSRFVSCYIRTFRQAPPSHSLSLCLCHVVFL
jgi:hypothetical protein